MFTETFLQTEITNDQTAVLDLLYSVYLFKK